MFAPDVDFFNDIPETSKRIPCWFSSQDDQATINQVLPFLGLNTDCSLNDFCLLMATPVQQPAPGIADMGRRWIPWDEDLREDRRYHLAFFQWNLYQQVFTYIGDDAIDTIPEQTAEDFHKQTFITISFVPLPELVYQIGVLSQDRDNLERELGDLRDEIRQMRHYLGLIMEFLAAREPQLAAPFDLILQPGDAP